MNTAHIPASNAEDEARCPDPVFALIEEHRAAYAKWEPLARAWNDMLATDPGLAAAEEAQRVPGDRESEAMAALIAARPTTLLGVLAMAEHLSDTIVGASISDGKTDSQRALRSVAAALGDIVRPDGPSTELLAMVERWKDLGLRIEAASDDAEVGRLSDQHTDLQIRIYRFPAASLADLRAKEPVFRDEMDDGVGPLAAGADPADTLAGSAWLGLLRDFDRLSGSASLARAAEAPDPVFAAIAASRAAEAEMKAFQATAETPTTPEWRVREEVLSGTQVDAQDVVWRTVPTTRAGRQALVDYARFQVQVRTAPDGYIDDAEGLIEEILTAFSASIAAEPGIPAQKSDEAQALLLVDALERAWAEDACRSRRDRQDAGPEADARHEAMLRHRDALMVEAERASAGTRAGRHAKALALAWLDHVELWRQGWPRARYATDGRLVFDIEVSLAAQIETGGRA